MADNTSVVGGDVVRDVDRGTAKTQVVMLDLGGLAKEDLSAPAKDATLNDILDVLTEQNEMLFKLLMLYRADAASRGIDIGD